MSRHRAQRSYNHRVHHLGFDHFRIHWTVDRYYEGDRLRHPTSCSRDTDKAGARRFIKRWNITYRIPEALK